PATAWERGGSTTSSFLPIDQVCDPQEVAGNARMVSITQAFAVDSHGPDPAGPRLRRGRAAGAVSPSHARPGLHAVLPAGAFALLCGTADAVQRQPRDRGRFPGRDRAARKRGGRGKCLLLPELDD